MLFNALPVVKKYNLILKYYYYNYYYCRYVNILNLYMFEET